MRGAALARSPGGKREAPVPAQQPSPSQAARVSAPDVDPGRPGDHRRPPAQGPSSAIGLTALALRSDHAGLALRSDHAGRALRSDHAAIQPIRDRATFLGLRRSGRRVRRGPVTVTWVPGEPDDPTRVAYTVGRKVGGAVVRNRVRRRLRAVVREDRGLLQPGAYLIGAGPEAVPMPYGELRAAACEALNALASGPSSPPPASAAKRPR